MNDRWQVISVSHHGVQPLADNSGGEGTQLSNSVSFIPGFSSDCLETLEEINEQNREFFIHGGGKQYEYIPALNDKVEHIDLLEAIIRDICEK